VKAGGGATEKNPIVAQLGMLGFSMILYFVLFFYGFAVARGIIQEKSGRVMEVLLGSMSHNQLITGKILGVAAVSLTQMLVYSGTAWAARVYIMLKQDPEKFSSIIELVAPGRILFFLVFVLLGYFLYTSLFAIVGAVSNTEQDAQNLQTPLVMMLIIPYVMSVFFVKHPDSPAAVAASFFPPFTPMVMFMRISVLTPPAWQIALAIALMLVAIVFTFRLAAKIFRIGSLMHGKRPTIPEILRWARA
jgi:ABC-2 type transport system permease protein